MILLFQIPQPWMAGNEEGVWLPDRAKASERRVRGPQRKVLQVLLAYFYLLVYWYNLIISNMAHLELTTFKNALLLLDNWGCFYQHNFIWAKAKPKPEYIHISLNFKMRDWRLSSGTMVIWIIFLDFTKLKKDTRTFYHIKSLYKLIICGY